MVDSPSLDPFSLQQDGVAAPEVDVGRGEVVEALVVSPMIVVFDEAGDPGFEVAQQEVVLQQNAVLRRLVPPLDLALVWGWQGDPRVCSIFRSASQSARPPAT